MKSTRYIFVALLLAIFSRALLAQSTATITGTVTDPSGAVVPGVQIKVHANGTGLDRTIISDNSGNYVVPSLQPGEYSVQAKATGFSTYIVRSLILQVDQKTTLNIPLSVAATGDVVQVEGTAPLIDAQSITMGQVIDQKTVQEIPLNGRHFLDLTNLVPGTVVPPSNGFLTAPSRGLGANSFNSAGAREDAVNYMINGINLNDLSQNQITFQPSINTTSEFKISNSTYSAEYGRSSGSIVNVATRSGTNSFHGEGFDYARNNYFDARNFFNRKGTKMNVLRRHNFGGAFSGPVLRDRTFFFLSYEGLRQSQDILFAQTVPTAAQRAAFANSKAGSAYAQLIQVVPVGNVSDGFYSGSSPGPVRTDQFTGDLSHKLSNSDQLHAYYAWQQDARTEPSLQGNTVPGFGDHRTAHRQIGTINEIHIFTPNTVNEARLGFNRIAISFVPNTALNPANYGISTGVNTGLALPQISVSDIGLNFGGPSGFPQGRFDTTGVLSDTLSVTKGKHSIKVGGEYRRFIYSSFNATPGTINFINTTNFINGLANSFGVTPQQVSFRLFISSASGFIQDSWKITPHFMFELGARYEWNGSPTEGGLRLVNFLAGSGTLQHVNHPYNQQHNFEPRVGFTYDVTGKGTTILRGGFGYIVDQPTAGAVTGLASNPPNSTPLQLTAPSSSSQLSVNTLYNNAKASGLAPSATNPNLHNAYMESYNLNLQHDLGKETVITVGYIGSQGRHLRLTRNINQFIYVGTTASRPYPSVASGSEILQGTALNNINMQDSASMSNYNALWLTLRKAPWHGLSFNSTYTYSKSMDLNSISATTSSGLQNNLNPANNYGLSDFDVRHHFVFSGTWDVPLHGSRLVEGWMLANITQLQGGNPLNITTTSNYNGITGTIRPNVVGPYSTGRAGYAGSRVVFIRGTGCTGPTVASGCSFYAPTTGFGNLSRNALTGPGFADTDLSLQKTTKLTERTALVLRIDAFDLLNHPNFGNPNLSLPASSTASTTATSGSTFGQISSTRNQVGDAGSSRQLQLAAKFTF